VRTIPTIEIHVAHSCNLTCESCSHYSNQGHKGIVSLEEAERWMSLWNRRVSPECLSLVGGEPTIHPHLAEFVKVARKSWPDASLRIVTNGFLLHRHPDLPLVLKDDPNAGLYISVHHASAEYSEKIKPALDLAEEWQATYGIQVRQYQSYENWTRRYKGFGADMQPYEDGKPRKSWEACPSKFAPQLFEGKIWKCPALTYLGMQNKKYGLSEKWQPYLQYQPLSPDCTDEELNEFFSRKEESYCGMCPSKPKVFELPIPDSALRRSVEARMPPPPERLTLLDRLTRYFGKSA
jgi:Radical SAM superfamily/4Fe-4S single cluster domain